MNLLKASKAPFTLSRFCTKTERRTSVFVSVHTDSHKNATKKEVFENAVKSGYSQKRRFLKTHLINVNAQKRRFFSPFLYENGAV